MVDVLRIKRRHTGNAGAPTQLATAELAFNEVDNVLYYGRGNNAGQAVTIIPIAGPGFSPPITPGGSNTQVQFNDGGAFAGDGGFTFNKTTDVLTVGDIVVAQWNGVSAQTELKLQSTGGGWGTSILRIKNETGVNGAMFETVPNPGAELVDFVFKVGTITQQNIRLEARPGQLISGNSWEFQLGSAGNSQVRIGNSITKVNLLTLGSDGTLTVAISGQTTFQYDPNTNNGTVTLGAKPPHGQLIQFCARSDITGSARFFGAANYSFDARISVPSDPTSDLELATKRYVDGKAGAGGTSITVSDTPPATPTDNSLWFESDTGALWLRYNDGNSTQWITISVPPGPTMGFLPLTGGTITGNLTISNNLLVQNYAEFGGGQSDGNFIFLANATVNGQLIIAPAGGWPTFYLTKTAGTAAQIVGRIGTSTRWVIFPGDQGAESTGNVGSDFQIQRFNDSGAYLGTALSIIRSNGNIFTGGFLGVNGGLGSVDVAMSVRHTHGAATYYWEQATAEFQDSRSMAAGVGGLIVFSGKYDTAGNYAAMGGIGAYKVNATSGDPVAGLSLWSRAGPINFYSGNTTISLSTVSMRLLTDARLRMYNAITWDDSGYPVINGSANDLAFQLGNDTGYYYWYNRSGAMIGKCYGWDGKWFNIQASWTAISDRSTKENIQPYPRGLKEILELHPVFFTYKSGIDAVNGHLRFGLIAQEVQPYLPELVGETDIAVAGEQQTVATLDPSNLIYACINAIKELSAEIESLKQQIGTA